MQNKHKIITVIILLSVTMYFSFAYPKAKYVGTNSISNFDIPYDFSEWQGIDVTDQLNINTADSRFNFINDAIGNQYINKNGEPLIFIILDAGNFHHPKVCFTGAGFKIKELPDTKFNLSNRNFKAHTLFTERAGKTSLSFYWIVIDKKIAHEWIEQKLKQFFFSMINKKRIGLMVRIDIPTTESTVDQSMETAKKFITDLNNSMKPDELDYIIGERND